MIESLIVYINSLQNHPKLARELKTCPFNARHLVPKHELAHHTETCEDRVSVDMEEGKTALFFSFLFSFLFFFNLNLIMFNIVNISYFTPLLQMEVQVQMDLVTGMSQSALGLTQT